MESIALALSAFRRHQSLSDLGHYTGILSLGGFCRLAHQRQDAALLEEARAIIGRFLSRDVTLKFCNYENYRCGGNGAAYLLHHGSCPEAAEQVRLFAEQTLHDAPKNRDGLVCHPKNPEQERVFIDQAFAVCPFMVYAGLALDEPAYVAEGCKQAIGMVDLLRDDTCGLLHQGVNFDGPGSISEDHWSRGNGWGIFALAELVDGLPDDHPERPGIEQRFVSLVDACLAVQDETGMFHQELTAPDCHVETSGSGLILYAVGVGLGRGLLGDRHRRALEQGLQGYLSYLAVDGSVHHTCVGCLCPDGGRLESYLIRAHKLNDPHAFGPVTLAFGQAAAIGISEI